MNIEFANMHWWEWAVDIGVLLASVFFGVPILKFFTDFWKKEWDDAAKENK